MKLDKNLLWALGLSAAFLLVWYKFFMPRMATAPVATSAKMQRSLPPSSGESSVTAGDKRGVAQAPSLPAVETERSVGTQSVRVVLSSLGAGVKHWRLKEKTSAEQAESESAWPDLVGHRASEPELWPLSTYPQIGFREIRTSESEETAESVWRGTLPNGVELEKRYVWGAAPQGAANSRKASHFLKLSLSFKNLTAAPVSLEDFQIGLGRGLGTIKSEEEENEKVTRVLAYPSPTREVEVFKSGEHKADYHWVGIDNRYYLFAFLPAQGQFDRVSVQKSKENPGEVKLAPTPFTLPPGGGKTLELNVYAGPKGYTQLKEWGLGLEHAVDFGYFGFLGKSALKAMYALHRITGNYGWSIMILTALLQVIVLPLSLKSYKSMAAMKKLQPKIQEMQKRYKDDPKRLNQEMLSLYRESGTNPFGGCLPMILQLPIFWAFFTMLRNSYELHGAPWVFWIHDLSQKDPYYILPIVMGAGMFMQQRFQGGSPGMDPAQAKMMGFMPIIFTFMFLNFPSGLVLYWLTNSLLSMSSQFWFSRKYA